MKLMTYPYQKLKTLKVYTREHREQNGNEIGAILDGIWSCDIDTASTKRSELYWTRQSNLREKCKFNPTPIRLINYIGQKDRLYKELDKYKSLYINGGNMCNIRDLMIATGMDNWLVEHKDDPDRILVGACSGSAVMAKEYMGIHLYDNLNTDWYGLGEQRNYESVEGLGILNDLWIQHWHAKPITEEDGYGGDLVEKVYKYRAERNLSSTMVSDTTMYVRDLVTGKEELVVDTGDGKGGIEVKTNLVNGIDILRNYDYGK